MRSTNLRKRSKTVTKDSYLSPNGGNIMKKTSPGEHYASWRAGFCASHIVDSL